MDTGNGRGMRSNIHEMVTQITTRTTSTLKFSVASSHPATLQRRNLGFFKQYVPCLPLINCYENMPVTPNISSAPAPTLFCLPPELITMIVLNIIEGLVDETIADSFDSDRRPIHVLKAEQKIAADLQNVL